ncbi:MAG: hypothetical protein GXP33_10860, partial [Spirochaetes bacterium]|nr:hypothetical protein [Spirochaetota bacterium]
FRSSEYYVTTTVSYGINVNANYSSGGGFSYGANAGYGHLNAGWDSQGGFRAGINAGNSGITGCGGAYSYNVGYNYDFSTGKISGQISADVTSVCFAAGTKVAVKGGEKNIEDIKAGDMVLARNMDTGEVGYKKVVQTFVHQADKIVRLDLGDEIIQATPEHTFWVTEAGSNGKWIKAGELKKGMKLLNADGKIVIVKGNTVEERKETVYNLEISDWHTYFVGNRRVLVHNSCLKDEIGSTSLPARSQLEDDFWRSVLMIATGNPYLVSGGISGLSAILFGGNHEDWIAATTTGTALGWFGKSLIAAGVSKDFVMMMMAEANYARTYALSRLAGQSPAQASWTAFSVMPLGMALNIVNLQYNYNPAMQKFLGAINACYQQFNIQSKK